MNKKTILAATVFVVLLVLVVMLISNRKQERGITRASFNSINTAEIDKISITGKNPVELKKQGDKWLLADNREADTSAVKQVLDAIPKIDSTDLITSDASRLSEFELDTEKGTHVVAYASDKAIVDFTVGKSAAGGTNMKIGDSVYLVKKTYPYSFSKPLNSWRKLKLFDAKPEDVTRVESTPQGQSAFALIKKDDKWSLENEQVMPKGFRFDPAAASSLVNELLNIRAQEVVTDNPTPEKTGLKDKFDVVAFVDKNNQRGELHLGLANDKEAYYAQIAGKEDVYLLSKYSVRNLRKQATELRDLKMVELDPEKATKLSISDGKGNLLLEKQNNEWKIIKSSEKVPDKFEFDGNLVKSRLQALANAKAMNVSKETAPGITGLNQPEGQLVATLEGGKTVSLVFGKTIKEGTDELSFAKGNIDADVYQVAKWSRGNLLGLLNSFKKRPEQQGMPNLDPQALSKLPPEVRNSLMKQMQEKSQQERMIKQIQAKMESEKKAPDKKDNK